MKKCPYCAEEIQDEAIKCKHCGEMVNAAQAVVVQQQQVAAIHAAHGSPAHKPATNPLAGLFGFLGAWAMYYGGSKWFGAHETQNSMAAGGAGEFSKPMMEQMMSSGLTYAGIGLGLFIFAGFIQAAANASPVTTASEASGIGPGEPQWVEIKVTTQKRSMYAALLGVVGGFVCYVVPLLMDFKDGQSMFLGLLGALAGAGIGWAATPKLMADEARNPSGFRKS